MDSQIPRIIGVLVGDIVHQPGARTKFGGLFRALGERFELVDVYDATLRGPSRFINAFQTFHPKRERWRQRFYLNVPAFKMRSQRVAAYLEGMRGEADLIFQVGAMFDARWQEPSLPSVIYSDYTVLLSARRPDAGRSPFTSKQLQQWVTWEQRAFNRASHICTWSEFAQSSLLEDYHQPSEKVTPVGGGLNFERLPELVNRNADPSRTQEPPTALFIGKDFYRKGGDLLLRAFARVREEVPNARLLMVTNGPIPAELPTEGVEIIAPTWDRTKIEALYRRADLFVLPSRLETWGDVLLEAMAYELPCIGMAGKAMSEIIVPEETGVLIEGVEQDISTLTAALVLLLSDRELRQTWGHQARQRVEERFTWERVVERMAPAIEEAAMARRARQMA